MLTWALIFLIFAIISAVIAFSSVAVTSAGLAYVFFYIFGGLFLLFLIVGLAIKPPKV